MKQVPKKIPGILPPPPKTEIDGKITDFSSKTIAELLELKERQLKLLNNKTFIDKLNDKGAKIRAFLNKIEGELRVKQEEQQTCILFDNLKISSVTKGSLQDIEWGGKLSTKQTIPLDSDDDSDPEDVLHILSQSTQHEKKVVVLPPEKPLITLEGLLDIGETPHANYLVKKTEKASQTQCNEKFKPYKTTKSDVHDPLKEINRKKHSKWEVTAATPPPILHGPVKMLSLEESLRLQKEHNYHLKEIEAHHAAEKLIARTGISMGEMPQDTSSFRNYRPVENVDSVSDSELGSDKEILDEEPEKGGVVFTVMN